jgi:plastocyanin
MHGLSDDLICHATSSEVNELAWIGTPPVKLGVVVRLLTALACCLLVVGALAAGGSARTHTTGPDQFLQIKVTLTDTNVRLSTKVVKRAQTVYFDVTNEGKLPHNFVIGGNRTLVLKHGKTDTFVIAFTERGLYGYKCTVNATKAMHGFIDVITPATV